MSLTLNKVTYLDWKLLLSELVSSSNRPAWTKVASSCLVELPGLPVSNELTTDICDLCTITLGLQTASQDIQYFRSVAHTRDVATGGIISE